MKALFDAIKSRFDGNVTLGAAYALVIEEAPESETLPTAIVTLLDSEVDDAFGSGYVETFNVQFDLYHTADTTVAGHLDTLHALFHHQTFSVTGATLIGVQRIGTRYLGKEGIDRDGNPVWHASAEYRFKVDR